MKHLLATALLAMVLAASAASANVDDGRIVALELGVHKLLREPQAIARVAVGDQAIADITVINGRELLITAKKTGITSLLVWPKGSNAAPKEYRLRVAPATDPLKAAKKDPALAKAVIDPEAGLSGQLPDLPSHRRAKQATARAAAANGNPSAKLPDQSTVDIETQVTTEVRIVEVKRSAMQQYGLNIFKNVGNTVAGLSVPGANVNVTTNGGYTNAGSNLPIANAFNLAIGNPMAGLLGILSILESKGLARTYAEPALTAMSGHTASFLAGGEFPVPVSQGGSTGGVTIQYREFGVRLSLTPTVLSRNRIGLKVAPEVSDLDFSAGISTGGVAVPALSIRRTDTTVELADGESFVISGLVSNNLVNNINKVPWLGDVPVLGAFFKSVSTSRTDKELIMIVTPHLVRPLKRGSTLPPLPGEKAQAFRPGFGHLIFEERGAFGQEEYGYSR